MLIDFDDTLFDTNRIVAVRPSGLDRSHSIIFTVGQSAVDGGFLVHVSYKEVCRRLRQSRLSELLEMVELMDAGHDEDEGEQEEESEAEGNAR